MPTVIKVEKLSKKYIIGHQEQERYLTLRDALGQKLKEVGKRLLHPFLASSGQPLMGLSATEDLWALKDVSFEINQGERVGIIGRNGAGKTTLLKILSRITEPTRGRIRVKGRVGSLLEVGTGFHPELTGRENIFLNGAVLGMNRAEIKKKFEEIIAFAEVEKFLDTPVKRYSSGMYVRLAFAVAAHLDPEVLLVDEVLAVGDAAFQKRCLGKMKDVSALGRTVLYVSHNMASISSLCDSCIYMEKGRIKEQSLPEEIIRRYLEDCDQRERTIPLAVRKDRRGSGLVRLTGIQFFDSKTNNPLELVLSGQNVYIEITYRAQGLLRSRQLDNVSIGLAFFNSSGQFTTVLNSQMANREFESLSPEGRIYCYIPRFPLMIGSFNITATLYVGGTQADQVSNACEIRVLEGDFFGSGFPNTAGRQGVYVDHSWSKKIK